MHWWTIDSAAARAEGVQPVQDIAALPATQEVRLSRHPHHCESRRETSFVGCLAGIGLCDLHGSN